MSDSPESASAPGATSSTTRGRSSTRRSRDSSARTARSCAGTASRASSCAPTTTAPIRSACSRAAAPGTSRCTRASWGAGMLDAAVPGGIFASPTALQVEARDDRDRPGHGRRPHRQELHRRRHELRHGGRDGRRGDVETVLVDDDVATESDDGPGRRGTAAVIAVEKICGAAAARGASLAEVAALGRRVAAGARSMAIALHAPTHPGRRARPSTSAPARSSSASASTASAAWAGAPHAPASELAEALLGPIARGARPAGRRARAADRQRPRRHARSRAAASCTPRPHACSTRAASRSRARSSAPT